MNREVPVRFWEGAGVRFPCATQLINHLVGLFAYLLLGFTRWDLIFIRN